MRRHGLAGHCHVNLVGLVLMKTSAEKVKMGTSCLARFVFLLSALVVFPSVLMGCKGEKVWPDSNAEQRKNQKTDLSMIQKELHKYLSRMQTGVDLNLGDYKFILASDSIPSGYKISSNMSLDASVKHSPDGYEIDVPIFVESMRDLAGALSIIRGGFCCGFGHWIKGVKSQSGGDPCDTGTWSSDPTSVWMQGWGGNRSKLMLDIRGSSDRYWGRHAESGEAENEAKYGFVGNLGLACEKEAPPLLDPGEIAVVTVHLAKVLLREEKLDGYGNSIAPPEAVVTRIGKVSGTREGLSKINWKRWNKVGDDILRKLVVISSDIAK